MHAVAIGLRTQAFVLVPMPLNLPISGLCFELATNLQCMSHDVADVSLVLAIDSEIRQAFEMAGKSEEHGDRSVRC